MESYNFRIRGVLKNSNTSKVREVQFAAGKLTGDLFLISELKHKCNVYEEGGDFENGYSPDTLNYSEDALSIIFIMHDICDNVQIAGTYPMWDTSGMDGVDLY